MDWPLSENDLKFMDENGYLVVKNVVEDEICDKLIRQGFNRAKTLFQFDKEDEDTWSAIPFHGIVDIWHAPALYELRQHPNIYSIFSQLLKTNKLCVSVDRISIKPPCRDDSITNDGLDLHTDLNFWHSSPAQPQFQGGLCLADCPIGGGGFFCIPGFHKPERIAKYKQDWADGKFGTTVPPKKDRVYLNFEDKTYTKNHSREIPLKKGDFVIWNSNLPHKGGLNTLKDHWRLHAYVRFMALDGPYVTKQDIKGVVEYRKMTNKCRKTGEKPTHFSTGNTIKCSPESAVREIPMHTQQKLTWLGQRIWGEVPWEK